MSKHSFWEALIITAFIFGLGILIGIFIENSRTQSVADLYLNSEISLLDAKLQPEIFSLGGVSCQDLISYNLQFGDKIYSDAKLLEKYENSNQITSSIVEQHRRYDILRAVFWVNSIEIKQKCNTPFHTVVYLYDYNVKNVEEASLQSTFSAYLSQLKEKGGKDIVLIPIAMDLNLTSIDLMAKKFGINQTSIIIDEKKIVTSVEDLPNIPKYLSS